LEIRSLFLFKLAWTSVLLFMHTAVTGMMDVPYPAFFHWDGVLLTV
jgi:hypothetical protein